MTVHMHQEQPRRRAKWPEKVAGAMLHEGLWVPTDTTTIWVRGAIRKRKGQQHTVEYNALCTGEQTEDVPSHKMVHTFTRSAKA